MDNIQPCPFCGSADIYWDKYLIDESPVAFLVCKGCGCEGPYAAQRRTALKRWNRRV